jgi:hypothetical protein
VWKRPKLLKKEKVSSDARPATRKRKTTVAATRKTKKIKDEPIEKPKDEPTETEEEKSKDEDMESAEEEVALIKKEETTKTSDPALKVEAPDVSEGVEVCISFDTTGSMYPCLSQVRRCIKETVSRLLNDVPHIRIALVAHGDYEDEGETYVIKTLNHTSDEKALIEWVNDVGPTCGYDGDECYELVLRDIQKLAWSPNCKNRSLILIGDANPHPLNSNNPYNIDWRKEARQLKKMDIKVYAVHALGSGHSENFYKTVASMTGGTYLQLSQFNSIVDFLYGICFRQNDLSQVEAYEKELRAFRKKEGRGLDRSIRALFDTLLGREATIEMENSDGLTPVPPGRFQILEIDDDIDKIQIKKFALEQGLIFKTGRGFYQFSKPEHISTKKDVVLMRKDNGDMYTGSAARKLLGITEATSAAKRKLKPSDFGEYDVFVQSTSYNRNLMGGTKFLYEVDEER